MDTPIAPSAVTHDDVLGLMERIETRLKPIRWVWALAAALVCGAFYCGKTFERMSSRMDEHTLVQQQIRSDLDAFVTSQRVKDDAFLKALNDLSTGQQLLNQRLEDYQNRQGNP